MALRCPSGEASRAPSPLNVISILCTPLADDALNFIQCPFAVARQRGDLGSARRFDGFEKKAAIQVSPFAQQLVLDADAQKIVSLLVIFGRPLAEFVGDAIACESSPRRFLLR